MENELLKNILDKAVQISPMVVLGMYLFYYLVNKIFELIEKWPDRQDRKVIRNLFQESTKELITISKKMVSFNDNLSSLCDVLKTLPNQILEVKQILADINTKVGKNKI